MNFLDVGPFLQGLAASLWGDSGAGWSPGAISLAQLAGCAEWGRSARQCDTRSESAGADGDASWSQVDQPSLSWRRKRACSFACSFALRIPSLSGKPRLGPWGLPRGAVADCLSGADIAPEERVSA